MISRLKALPVVSISAALLVLAAAVPAPAQTVPDRIYRYTVMWSCFYSYEGITGGQVPKFSFYRTLIDVHNPSGEEVTVHEQDRIAFTAKTEVPTGATVAWGLSPGEVVIIDCEQIESHFPEAFWNYGQLKKNLYAGSAFRTGFVILDSPIELDVASLQTHEFDDPTNTDKLGKRAGANQGGSLDVEYHQPRILLPNQEPVEPVTLQLEALSRFVGDIRDALLRSIGGTE